MSLFRGLIRCGFCRLRYEAVPFDRMGWVSRLIAICGIRRYECPHCFCQVSRPWLPVQWIFRPFRMLWNYHPGYQFKGRSNSQKSMQGNRMQGSAHK